MKIAALGCIHGDIENLSRFLDKIALMDIDVLVCPGDFTDYTVPKGFTRLDIGRIILEEMKALGRPVVVVPGSWDKELIDFFKNEKVSVHGDGKVIDGVGFFGYGGAKTPFNTPFEPSEGEIELGLGKAFSEVKNSDYTVQVTHAPPHRTMIDVISSGAHVGSEVVRRFIEKNHPNVAISSHIHESRGVDELGISKIVNPGRFPEGHFGLIEINKSGVVAKVSSLI